MLKMKRGGSSLRYVGSPYQTSLSEAGQDKFLYCLSCLPVSSTPGRDIDVASHAAENRYEWKEVERWVLNVGKKYFKVFYCLFDLCFFCRCF